MGNTKEIRHLSLCAGYGGIDLGLSRVIEDIRTICFVEIEAFAIENLVAKIEAGLLDLAPVYTDLKTFPFGKFRGCVDILSGGFPCQPFSVAGQRAGTEDPRHLFPYILKGITECRPPVVFLENVEGIISSKLKGDRWNDPEGTPVLLHVLRELERVGYQATAGVFSAAEVGAPHQRKRVFIAAVDLTGSTSERITRALIHQRGGALEGRRAGISSGRDSQIDDTRLASICYPAGRGQEQYGWEPPRTVGNAQSDTNRDDSENAGTPYREIHSSYNASLARESSELGNANSERREQDLEQSRIEGAAGVVQRPGASLDNADREGCLRDLVDEACSDTEGREIADGYDASTSASSTKIQGQIEPALGRNFDGSLCGVDYAKLCLSVDNRTDELRLLGNGVVPETAARAFYILWRELAYASRMLR